MVDHLLEVAQRRIVRLCPAKGCRPKGPVQSLGHGMLLPGFIDLQVNPVGAFDILTKGPNALPMLAARLAKSGCTGFLLALITDDLCKLEMAVSSVLHWVGRATGGARLLGIHLEGPFLNPTRRGVHPLRYIKRPTQKDVSRLLKAAGDSLRMMTLAPEIPGAIDLLAQLRKGGIVASIGHSNATYDQALRSFEKGVRSATHLFNASTPFHHRAPGIVGAVLDSPSVTAQIIPDGFHVHGSAVRMVYRIKGKKAFCAVTDALAGGGRHFAFAGTRVQKQNRRFVTRDGTLAGSSLNMAGAFTNLQSFVKAPLEDLIECLGLTPATLLGLKQTQGSLEPGKDADMVWMSDNGDVQATWVKGESVYVRNHRVHR